MNVQLFLLDACLLLVVRSFTWFNIGALFFKQIHNIWMTDKFAFGCFVQNFSCVLLQLIPLLNFIVQIACLEKFFACNPHYVPLLKLQVARARIVSSEKYIFINLSCEFTNYSGFAKKISKTSCSQLLQVYSI